MQLQEGDVIPLSRKATEPAQVYVNKKPKFSAMPGKSGKHRAIRIQEVQTHENREDRHERPAA